MSVDLKAAFVAGILICVLPCIVPDIAGTAMALENPVLGFVPVYYKYEGQAYLYRLYSTTAWKVNYDGWDGHFTEEGRKFDHMHPGPGFPFQDGYNHEEAIEVTASMCNDYYDPLYAGFTRSSGATCASNCHGYATGRSFCIKSSADGMLCVLGDEYEIVTSEMEPFSGPGIFSNYSEHSVRVLYYGCTAPDPELWGEMRSRSEKKDASGVYSKDYYPNSGSTANLPGCLYRADAD